MDYMDRLRIQYEERLRAKARDDYEAEKNLDLQRHYAAQEREIAKLHQRRRFVEFHGHRRAFEITLRNWAIGGGILAILSFIGSLSDDGFFKSLGNAFVLFLACAGIGFLRANHIVNSVR